MEQSSIQTVSAPDSTIAIVPKIKVLPAAVIKEIEQQNKARRLMGLSSIDIKTRTCLHCGGLFQSAGRRTCGCNTIHTSSLAGVEII